MKETKVNFRLSIIIIKCQEEEEEEQPLQSFLQCNTHIIIPTIDFQSLGYPNLILSYHQLIICIFPILISTPTSFF